MMCKSGKFT